MLIWLAILTRCFEQASGRVATRHTDISNAHRRSSRPQLRRYWSHTTPWDQDDDCIQSVWRMTCYTYFPKSARIHFLPHSPAMQSVPKTLFDAVARSAQRPSPCDADSKRLFVELPVVFSAHSPAMQRPRRFSCSSTQRPSAAYSPASHRQSCQNTVLNSNSILISRGRRNFLVWMYLISVI